MEYPFTCAFVTPLCTFGHFGVDNQVEKPSATPDTFAEGDVFLAEEDIVLNWGTPQGELWLKMAKNI